MYRNVIHRTKIVFVHSLRTEQQKSTMFIAFNSTSLFIRSHLEFFVYMRVCDVSSAEPMKCCSFVLFLTPFIVNRIELLYVAPVYSSIIYVRRFV